MIEFVLAVLSLGTGVFAASAGAKLRSHAAFSNFRAGLRATALISERQLRKLAVVLVTAETTVAASLPGGLVLVASGTAGAAPLAESALAAAAALIAILAAGVTIVIRRGTQARCACFGGRSSRPLGITHLIRNSCLLLVLAAALVVGSVGLHRTAGGRSLAGLVVAVLAGAVVALLFIRWDDLADLFAPIPASQAQPSSGRRPA